MNVASPYLHVACFSLPLYCCAIGMVRRCEDFAGFKVPVD